MPFHSIALIWGYHRVWSVDIIRSLLSFLVSIVLLIALRLITKIFAIGPSRLSISHLSWRIFWRDGVSRLVNWWISELAMWLRLLDHQFFSSCVGWSSCIVSWDSSTSLFCTQNDPSLDTMSWDIDVVWIACFVAMISFWGVFAFVVLLSNFSMFELSPWFHKMVL